MAAGDVAIKVSMNTSHAEKDLAELKAKIERFERNIKSDEEGLGPLNEDLKAAKDAAKVTEDQINKLTARIAQMRELAEMAGIKKPMGLGDAEAKLKSLEKELKEQNAEVERLDSTYTKVYDRIAASKIQLEDMKNQAGQMEAKIDEANSPMGRLQSSLEEGGKSAAKLWERIKSLAMSALVFSAMSSGFAALRNWTGKVIKSNDEARASFARLQGALLTLVQPLVQVIIPAFTAFVNILTVIVSRIAAVLSALFGSTLEQSSAAAESLYEETNALNGLGGAAKKAKGSLAGFDEINTINTDDSGGGGAGAGSSDIMPDFTLDSGISKRLKEIADLVLLIGAGLALWKIGTMLPGVLGTIATILGGILLTVGGLLLAWHGLSDAWENGVDWGNLIESIGGVAAAALGLYLIFGKIGAGIALIVGGIALLVTAFHDAMNNGWNLQNTLMAISGLLAGGLGISLLTGSWIPLLVTGIASVLLALVNLTGHGEELIEGLKLAFKGFVDFFTGIFTGDLEKAKEGILAIFLGLKTAGQALISALKDAFFAFYNWLDAQTGGKLSAIVGKIKALIQSIVDFFTSSIDKIKALFQKISDFFSITFVNWWKAAWENCKNIFKGVWNGIIGFLENAVNLIVTGINWLIKQMNKISFSVPDWVPGIGGKSVGVNIPSVSEVSIPRLAQGAVIPPNREFAAILGDQPRGYNIEAPEDLIRKIVREETGGNAEMVALLRQILSATKAKQKLYVKERVLAETARDGINDMTRQAGKPVLLF